MLIAIKVLHTIIWALLAACVLALPVTGFKRRFNWSLLLTVVILIECGVIALNRGRCPMTNLAAHFTPDRADNFDIYLPVWLARYNKQIFGSLFLLGEAIVVWRRLTKPGSEPIA